MKQSDVGVGLVSILFVVRNSNNLKIYDKMLTNCYQEFFNNSNLLERALYIVVFIQPWRSLQR